MNRKGKEEGRGMGQGMRLRKARPKMKPRKPEVSERWGIWSKNVPLLPCSCLFYGNRENRDRERETENENEREREQRQMRGDVCSAVAWSPVTVTPESNVAFTYHLKM